MNKGFINVPFKADSGFSSVNGIAKFSAAGIVLEFESKLLGLVPEGIKEVRVPIGEVFDIRFKKGFFKLGAKIVVRTKNFATLSKLPHSDGKLTLKLDRDDFDRGREAVDRMLGYMAGETGEKLSGSYSPVGRLISESEDETKRLEYDTDFQDLQDRR